MLRYIFRRLFRKREVNGATIITRERYEAALRTRQGSLHTSARKTLRFASGCSVIMGACYVVDGDTIKIKQQRIRLMGIDAPEMDQPYGEKAKWAMHGLTKGQIVSVHIVGEDIHGRSVGICYLQDGRDLAAELVRMGLALDWPYFSKGKYAHLEPEGIRKILWRQDQLQSTLAQRVRDGASPTMPA